MGMPSPSLLGKEEDSADGGFNIDDLVKKIDAKIAEIEKEEENTKKLEEQKATPFEELVENKVQDNNAVIDTKVEEIKEPINTEVVKESPKTEIPISNMYENNTNDDDFFDDFFSDD